LLDRNPDNASLIRSLAASDLKIPLRSFALANTAQARKRARQSELRRQRNASQRSAVRTHFKNALQAIASGDKTKAMEAFKQAVPVIDSSARKGLIGKNTAARQKSLLNKRLKAIA
jgi:small subunit ribosomal protein S20